MAVRPRKFQQSQQRTTTSIFALVKQDKKEARQEENARRKAEREQWERDFVVRSLGMKLLDQLRQGKPVICEIESKEFEALLRVMEHPRNTVEKTYTPQGSALFSIPRKAA